MFSNALKILFGMLSPWLSAAGKFVLSWALQKLWKLADEKLTESLARKRLQGFISEKLAEHEQVVLALDERLDRGEQPTAEELDEYRKKKIAIEEALFNGPA